MTQMAIDMCLALYLLIVVIHMCATVVNGLVIHMLLLI